MVTSANIAVFMLVFCSLLLSVRAVYHMLPRSKWFCRELGWHDGYGGEKSFDGCSHHATCSRCGASVMMDSQGNWFTRK